MTSSISLTDNLIGWAPMSLRIALPGNMIASRTGAPSATANAGPVSDRRDSRNAATSGDVRADN